MIRQTCLAATSRQASAETMSTVMVISPLRKAAFQGKYCPWNLKDHRDMSLSMLSMSTIYTSYHLTLMRRYKCLLTLVGLDSLDYRIKFSWINGP